MALKCANGTFSWIAAVDVRWYKLVAAAIVCDGLAEGATAFIIHNNDCGQLAGSAKAGVQCLVSSNAVDVLFSCKGLDQDSIASVEGNHYVLVSTGSA